MGYTVLFVSLLTAIFTILLIKNAKALNLVDIPNDRSAHITATPRGAGIAIICCVLISGMFVSSNTLIDNVFAMLGLCSVLLLGIYDDYKHSSSNLKVIVIGLAGLLACLDGFVITSAGNYFGTVISFGWLAYPVTIFAIVGFTNALNLIDGLDGLSGSISLIILSGLGYIGYLHGDTLLLNFITLLIPALIVFLVFNWNPAKIFLGDSGSLTLGFLISVFGIKALDYIDPISILFITAIPILDTITIMLRRKQRGLPLFQPDKCHFHHLLLTSFNSNVKLTVIIIAAIQISFTLFGVFVAGKIGQGLALPIFIFCFLLFYSACTKLAKDQNC